MTKIITDVYGSKDAPDAAKFGKGVSTLAKVKEATEARDRLSQAQSNPKGGPVARDH